jgi:hypothetical protein
MANQLISTIYFDNFDDDDVVEEQLCCRVMDPRRCGM